VGREPGLAAETRIPDVTMFTGPAACGELHAVRRASPSGHWPRPAAGAGGRLSAYLRIVAASGPCDLSVTSVVSFSLLGTGQARYGQICWLSAGRRRVTPSPIPGELFQPNRGG